MWLPKKALRIMDDVTDEFMNSGNLLGQIASAVSGDTGSLNSVAQINSFQAMFKRVSRTPQMVMRLMHPQLNFDRYIDCYRKGESVDEDEILKSEWGRSTFVLPSTKYVGKWLDKCIQECKKGRIVCAIVPASTNTAWFHNKILQHDSCEVRFIQGRLQFPGFEKQSRYPSAIAIYWPDGKDRRSTATFGAEKTPALSILTSFTSSQSYLKKNDANRQNGHQQEEADSEEEGED